MYTLCYKPPDNFTEEEWILLVYCLYIDLSLLKHEWEGNKQIGLNVENGDTLEPTEVVKTFEELELKKKWCIRQNIGKCSD